MIGINQINEKVKNLALPPVVALGGGERALLDEALNAIRHAYLSPSTYDLNHHKMMVGEDSLDNLTADLYSVPFLASFRVVELHNAEKLAAGDVATIEAYLAKPSTSTVLILVYHKIDKRNKLISQIDAAHGLFTFAIEEGRDRIKFVLGEAKACGVSLAANAAEFLLLASSGDLLTVRNTLEKMALVYGRQELTIDDIEKNIRSNGEMDGFVFARHLSEGHLSDSLIALGHLRNGDENAVKLLGLLIWQFRVLVHIRTCLDRGMSDWDIRKQVSVFGDRYAWMAHVAKKRTLLFHIDRLTKLVDCDYAIKTGAVAEPFHYLEKIVYQSVVGL